MSAVVSGAICYNKLAPGETLGIDVSPNPYGMAVKMCIRDRIKQQNRDLKASITNLVSQPNPATSSSEDDAISLMDVARLIGQKIEVDGKLKSELTDVAIVLGKRIRRCV